MDRRELGDRGVTVKRPAWHEDDAFWDAMHPVFFTDAHWASAPRQVDDAIRLLGLAPGMRVLDLACGPGRHALAFARRGMAVTGLDRTERYLAEARRRADAEDLDVRFVRGDMRCPFGAACFDAVVSLSTSFGYFADRRDDDRVLAAARGALAPGGRILVEMMDRDAVARDTRPRVMTVLADGTDVVEQRQGLDAEGVFRKTRTLRAPDGSERSFAIAHRVYTAAGLVAALGRAGFVDLAAYADLAGAPHDERAQMVVAVGRV